MELLTVIVMIGILSVAVAPSAVNLMRDRRVARAGFHIVDYFRTARTRAMGHGQPITVVWNGTGAQIISIVEPIVTGAGASPTCLTAPWGTAAQVNVINSIDLGNPLYQPAQTICQDNAGATKQYVEICFTPAGRAFYREDPAAAFTLMTRPIQFQVTNTNTQLVRYVFVPPSGLSRMQL
jgi:Tfp pilus assembly protein FimT